MLHQPRLLASLLLAAVATSACAATQVGEPLELTGKLVLRGTAQFHVPAIVTTDRVWELEGVTKAQVDSFQSREVKVRGKVLKAPESKTTMPVIQVENLDALPR